MCLWKDGDANQEDQASWSTWTTPAGNWLLFMTGNGITWVRDGKSEADAASASGDGSSKSDKDFKLRHAVDIGMLAEAPLRPADHAETSLSDFPAEQGQAPTSH